MNRATGCLVILAALGFESLRADPVLSRPETVAGRIIIYPDHRDPKRIYYVPARLVLGQTLGRPQFLFYKYVYVKGDEGEVPRTTAGGVLTLAVEFGDEKESLKVAKGQDFEYRPVPIETLECILSYGGVEEEGAEKEKKEIASKKILWADKNFTLPLSRESASFLWQIFEERKATALSVECLFSYGGYELDEENKLKPAERHGRLTLAVPVSMDSNPELFMLVNLAEKISFNYRRLSVLCFDFINGTNGETVKIKAEIEIITARKQRDFRVVQFASGTEPQQDLEFNVPEIRGGRYRYRLTRVYQDGRLEKGKWLEGDDAFLDISTYKMTIRESSMDIKRET